MLHKLSLIRTSVPVILKRVSLSQKLLTLTVCMVYLLIGSACSPPSPDESGYVEELLKDRIYKDEAFLEDEDSPVPLDRRSWMLPLRYYEPDLSYRVPAELNVSSDQPIFKIPTSTGQLRSMQRVGLLEFKLNGESRTLSAFVELPSQESGQLFVPFRDETSSKETYPGGRYLDLDQTPTGIYDLDFNRAYTPFCYFSEDFDCPFPPPENRLTTAIRAGERLPDESEQRLPIEISVPPDESFISETSGN